MRPRVESLTTLMCLMKRKPMFSPVKWFIAMRCSADAWSPISNINVAVGIASSKWPFAT